MTGLPGAGKSTLAAALQQALLSDGERAVHIDGDELRRGICADLGFDAASRHENLRRAAYIARMLAEGGCVVIASLISPYAADRALVADVHQDAGIDVIWAWVDAPLSVCEQRDPKGLYARARQGELSGMTGIDAPYEPPENADVRVATARQTVSESLELILDTIAAKRSQGHVSSLGQVS